jgi:L-malate glycosyltransferase
MKICFLAGANSIHSYKWIKYFAERGHEIHWISLVASNQPEIKNIKFYYLKGNSIGQISKIKKLIQNIKPDILHAHYAGINGLIAALSGFHPFVLTAWGSDILLAGKSKIKSPFIKYTLHKASLITCDAEHMKEAMIRLGADHSKINIVYFGVDTERFSPGAKDEEIVQKVGGDNSPLIISLRSLEPVYDLETLINAIPLVVGEAPEARFVIAGKGSEEEKLKQLVRSLCVEKNVRFIGLIPNNTLPRYLRTADIYVSTSLSDAGIAASTAEAMACGLPVVITETGENKKWVEDGKDGFVIPVKNAEILAEKINYLIKNKKEGAEFGRRARGKIEEKNNYLKEMAKMEEIYEKISGKNSRFPK